MWFLIFSYILFIIVESIVLTFVNIIIIAIIVNIQYSKMEAWMVGTQNAKRFWVGWGERELKPDGVSHLLGRGILYGNLGL